MHSLSPMMGQILGIILFLFASPLWAAPLCSDLFVSETSHNEILISNTVNKKVYELIGSAKSTLDLSIATIPNSSLIQALVGKANEGVKIRMILDGRHFQKDQKGVKYFNEQIRALNHPNIDLRVTSPVSLSGNRGFQRAVLHRKILIVDGKDLYTGSSNLGDYNNIEVGYFTSSHSAEIREVFESDFKNIQARSFTTAKNTEKSEELTDSVWVGPNTARPSIEKEVLDVINEAQQRLWVNVFELTAPSVLDALVAAKQKNPQMDIRVLLNEEPVDFWIAGKKFERNANEAALKVLEKNKIPTRVYKGDRAVLHGRFIVSDNSVIAGSFDLTHRSFEGNIDLGFSTKDAASVEFVADQCATLWESAAAPSAKKFSLESSIGNFIENKVVPRLKVRAAPSVPLSITYGWEVEFQTNESPLILNYYRLKSISDREWEGLSLEKRRETLKASLSKTPKLIRSLMSYFGMAYLVRMDSAPQSLPAKALLESHGTVELVGQVESTVSGLQQKTQEIESLMGRGYWQSHVVFPKIHVENISGWISFTSDAALLGHLEASYQSYLKDSRNIPGSVLSHYALGPLDAKTFSSIKSRETSAVKGKDIGSGGKDRLIYGPALRDDAYPEGLVGVELRQFSKRREDLMRESENLSRLLEKNQLFLYNGFKETKMLDFKLLETLSQNDRKNWLGFLKDLDYVISKDSPNVVVGGAPYSLRFLLPLRNWEDHPVLQLSKLSPEKIAQEKDRLTEARRVFVDEVNGIIGSEVEMSRKVELMKVAVARWAYTVKLSEFFTDF